MGCLYCFCSFNACCRFRIAAKKISEAQEKLARKNNVYQKKSRVFHAKQHACLSGKLKLFTHRTYDVKQETFVGLFDVKNKSSYDLLIRFSNGLGIIQHDKEPDVRGIAMKIFDVKSEQTGKITNVDLLMTNSPTPVAKNLNDFVSFMEYIVNFGPTQGSIRYAVSNPDAAPALFGGAGILPYGIRSLTTIQYWSGHPYLLGPNKAMKLTLIPQQKRESKGWELLLDGENYLRQDLDVRLKNESVKFTLALQLEVDPVNTPIENNLKEWTPESSPFIPVGEVIIEKRYITGTTTAIESICDNMIFTPANYIPEHRPLSNMGRGRLVAYRASQMGRIWRSESRVGPSSNLVKYLRKISETDEEKD